jgi:hypothetical protein
VRPLLWREEEAVLKLVKQRLEELRNEIEHFDPNSDLWVLDLNAPLPTRAHELMQELILAELMRGEAAAAWLGGERAAAEAALRGDLHPLAGLLLPHKQKANPAIKQLKWETWELIAEFLLGKRNLKTGKKKGERGPRRKSPEERRKKTPVHDAADLMHVIKEILGSMFPKQRPKDIHDRAILFAAEIKSVDPKTLENYLKRPQQDRRRM